MDPTQKTRVLGGRERSPQVSYTGQGSFAIEPTVPHSLCIPDWIYESNFRAEMDPETREQLGHLAGRGTLLSGFAGTGKTSLIRHLAKEDGAVIIPVEKDDSAGILRAKFEEAREHAKSRRVYLVLDEIDEFGSKEALGADVPKISMLLREIDGLQPDTSGNLYFFATTNNLPAVDQRLLRPGRLEELVEIPLPSTAQKERILPALIDGLPAAKKIAPHFPLIARKSKGYTPADLRGFLKDLLLHVSENGRATIGKVTEELVLHRLKLYQPTAKKGFEYFKEPEFPVDELVGRELYLNFFRRILENNKSANCLLYGPNGTGKTLLPEVLADLLDYNFIKASGSELQEGIVGEGTKKIKKLFNLAKLAAPSIVLFDETEGIISRRGTISHRDDETAYLNSILSRPIPGVYVFITTNTPHLLNETTLTRFSYKAFFGLPEEDEIHAYLQLKGINALSSESLIGYSFRDLENIARVCQDYREEMLKPFLAKYTPENRARSEDWEMIKDYIGDSLGLERLVRKAGGQK